MRRLPSLPRNRGFTLVEIMLVVTLIVMLLGAAIYRMSGNINVTGRVVAEGDIQAYKTQLQMYQVYTGSLPTTQQGLQALISRPEGVKGWRKGAMDSLNPDPWKEPYVYVQPGKHNPNSYDLFSKGPDKVANTDDDIGNWEN